MTNTSPQTASAIGLDVGTSRIVTARRKDKDIQFAKQLNAFVTIPFSKLTQGVLKKERIPHLVQDSEIIVYGDESERFANLFHKETRRPMLRGVLNKDETESPVLVRYLVTSAHRRGCRRRGKKALLQHSGGAGWRKRGSERTRSGAKRHVRQAWL